MNASDKIIEFPPPTSRKQPRKDKPLESTQPQAKKEYVICLAVLPSKGKKGFDYKGILLPALRTVLELDPYYWQVAALTDKVYGETILENLKGWIEKEHPQVYILDMSDTSHPRQVDRVIGYLFSVAEVSPILIIALEHKGTKKVPDAEQGKMVSIEYTPSIDQHAVQDIAKELDAAFKNRDSIQQLTGTSYAHYLSPLYLQRSVSEGVAKILSSTYKTMEAFAKAKTEHIRSCLRQQNLDDMAQETALGCQKSIKKSLKASGIL